MRIVLSRPRPPAISEKHVPHLDLASPSVLPSFSDSASPWKMLVYSERLRLCRELLSKLLSTERAERIKTKSKYMCLFGELLGYSDNIGARSRGLHIKTLVSRLLIALGYVSSFNHVVHSARPGKMRNVIRVSALLYSANFSLFFLCHYTIYFEWANNRSACKEMFPGGRCPPQTLPACLGGQPPPHTPRVPPIPTP